MMSFKSISNSEQAVQYYESLATEDYYELGGEPSGYWLGQLRSTLYLNGEVSSGELGKMLQGYHPISGEALASNAGVDHKGGWDMTFSAPKSLSVIWALADQETRIAIQAAKKNQLKRGLSSWNNTHLAVEIVGKIRSLFIISLLLLTNIAQAVRKILTYIPMFWWLISAYE